MAFALVAGQTGTIRTNSGTLQTVSINLFNSFSEIVPVGYNRLTTNVTLTVAFTGSAGGGTSPVITVSSSSQFAVGDKIWIETNIFGESASIQSIAGNNITLTNVPFFNHNVGNSILRFTNNQTLCVAIFNPVGDYIVAAPKVTINGTATDLLLVDGSTATGAVSAVNGQSLLYVLPILSPQVDLTSSGYTITCSATNLAGVYQSIHFNAMTFTGANIPSSTSNANLPKTSGGTLLDGFSGTFGSALVMSAGSPKRIDLGTVITSYDTQQQPFIAIAASTNTAFPSNYTRTITTGANVDSSNNVTGALVSAITCTGTSGASTITVSSAPNTAGFVANGVYTISDGANTETIQLTGLSVGGTTTLNLVSPLANSHTSAPITYASGFLPAAAMITAIGTGSVAQAWGVAGSAVVRTAISTFLPANGTQLYIHANGVGETCTVSSGGGTNILTMTANLSRSYQNGIISTSPIYLDVPSPYGGYTIQANSIAAPANSAVLSVASGTGTKTSLSVNALPVAIVSGASLLLRLASNPATTQTVVLSAAASAGATTLSITSVSFASNFPIGTTLVNTGAGFAPLSGQGGGLVGATLYPSNTTANNLTAFTQPAGQNIMATSVPLIATTAGQSSGTSSTLVGTSPYPVGGQQFQSSTTVNSYVQNFRTATTAGGTVSGNFMMFGGYNYGGTPFITPEILINAGGSGTAFSGWGYIYTFVPASPAITRAGSASESPTTRASSLKDVLKSAAQTLSTTLNGIQVVAVIRSGANQITTAIVASQFATIAKSSASTVTQSTVATKVQGYFTSAATALSQTAIATKLAEVVKSASQTLSQTARATSLVGVVKSAASQVGQSAIAGRIVTFNKQAASTLGQVAVGVSQTVATVSTAVVGVVIQRMALTSEKVVAINKNATNALSEKAIATSTTVRSLSGVVSTAMRVTSSRTTAFLRSSSQTLTQNVDGVRIVARVRSNALALVSATVATRSAEMNKAGASSTQAVIRATKAQVNLRANSQALRIVVVATKQAIFSRNGIDTLFQTAKFASFIYTIANTLPAIFKETAKQLAQADPRISAFSEITERGLYREQPTQQSFNEDATQIFTEGQ
jgi:hypothetical protein